MSFVFAPALRKSFAAGYGVHDLRSDVLAGLVVGVVALPLSMALAIASGVAPQHGLATAIVAGGLTALLGGSRVQVSGPTAAFVVVLAPIAARFGVGGLMMATAMAGVLLIAMGLARMGQLVEFVPHPVTTGFTAGIAVVIATLQLKDFLGLATPVLPEHYLDRLGVLAQALPTVRWPDAVVGLVTLAILLAWPRLRTRVPGPLVALVVAGLVAELLARAVAGASVATIATRFSYVVGGVTHAGIPSQPPLPVLPWLLPGPDGRPLGLGLDLIRALAPSAFAIAMLGAIESLLSAVVADGMLRDRHDPDAELLAQGVGNVVAPFFGGIAATGAIARTATNIRAGARSPMAAVVHALVVLAAVLVAAPLLGRLPMAALAALLLVVAWNMSDIHHFLATVRKAPRSDVVVLLACFLLTVVFDMVVAVTFGIVLASLLFMRRMAEVSGVTLVGRVQDVDLHGEPLPRGLLHYSVAGPLFFGAAQKAIEAIERVDRRGVKVVLLDLRSVPAVDATGLVALESLVERLNREGVKVVLGGVGPAPLRVFARAGWRNRRGRLRIYQSFDAALLRARDHALHGE